MYLLCIIGSEETEKLSAQLCDLFIQDDIDIYPLKQSYLSEEASLSSASYEDACAYTVSMVFLITREFLESDINKIAILHAVKFKKNIIFVYLEKALMPDWAENIMKNEILAYKIYDFNDNSDITKLYMDIKQLAVNHTNAFFEKFKLDESMSSLTLKDVDVIYEALKANKDVFETEREATRRFMIEMATKKHSQVTEKDILMYALGKTFEQNGYEMVMTKKSIENDDLLQLHTKLWLHGLIFGMHIYKTVFEVEGDKTSINAQKIKNDIALRNLIINAFYSFICETQRLDANSINVIDIVDGSVAIKTSSMTPIDINAVNSAGKSFQIPIVNHKVTLKYKNTFEHKLIKTILVPEDFLNPQYNMDYTTPRFNGYIEKRGNMDYHFPYKWKRYALNLQKYGYKDLNWLTMNNSKDEFGVAFHGIRETKPNRAQLNHNIPQLKKQPTQILNGIVVKPPNFDVTQQGLMMTGHNNVFGEGIYCTPLIEVAKDYTTPVNFDGKYYRIALQCRIHPKRFQKPSSEHFCNQLNKTLRDVYYVVEDSTDIRPYGILLTCDQW